MPELPEIHRFSELINKSCAGKVFKDIQQASTNGKCPDVSNILVSEGKLFSITSTARGKELRLELRPVHNPSSVYHITYTHGLTGKWFFDKASQAGNHRTGHWCQFFTQSNDFVLTFHDPQRMGRWTISSWAKSRGPDPLSEFPSFKQNIYNSITKPIFTKSSICEMLLNQTYFNGIGNYLRAEIIYRSRVDWNEKADTVLNGPRGSLLLALCKEIPKQVLTLGLNKYGTPQEVAKFETWLQCYGKKQQKKQGGGRTIWYDSEIHSQPVDSSDQKLHDNFVEEEGGPAGDMNDNNYSFITQSLKEEEEEEHLSEQYVLTGFGEREEVEEEEEESEEEIEQPKKRASAERERKMELFFGKTVVVKKEDKNKGQEKVQQVTKMLYLVGLLYKAKLLTAEERSKLKRMVFEDTKQVGAVLEYFEAENDFLETADTLKCLCLCF
eukprot:TRINITY_DN5756_c0_g2_i1.p1 TRINITY_DN5756_c0_g2~~TRINITY_DN5756_c0_g2_i1.p1  ORF type:complete len:440 (-),score=92.61 TRINITY_DN5756_c0_g2_i1:106-1425(-)